MNLTRSLAGCVGLLAAAAAAAGTPVARYACTLVDGSTRILALRPFYSGAAVTGCTLLQVQAVEREPLPLRPAAPRPDPQGSRFTPAQAPVLEASAPYAGLILEASRRHDVDPLLVAAVMQAESGGQADARSTKGAMGLMQVMPATAERYGVTDAAKLREPAVNIDVGLRYLADLLRRFGGSLELAAAAYNAGEGAVLRGGWSVPPFPETQAYVRRVMSLLNEARP